MSRMSTRLSKALPMSICKSKTKMTVFGCIASDTKYSDPNDLRLDNRGRTERSEQIHGCRDRHSRNPGCTEVEEADIARACHSIPDSHCNVRLQAACNDHRESQRDQGSRATGSRARSGQDSRTAPRHSDRAEGQYPYDQHAHD